MSLNEWMNDAHTHTNTTHNYSNQKMTKNFDWKIKKTNPKLKWNILESEKCCSIHSFWWLFFLVFHFIFSFGFLVGSKWWLYGWCVCVCGFVLKTGWWLCGWLWRLFRLNLFIICDYCAWNYIQITKMNE